ncbi:MAG: bifunctional lysylphosphatidylglycerol flippase/synthetase MprF [Bavariicoccus seileri]|uniref:bifunctional lysylphosphatidylglycerol flippase/synthetase MprF n=1 Tax=Bavariicoccus seileri TaxID=549685 RepID=UPI0003B649C6|nr:bifunctional lysylphosphatidylglycerol flippase/synthetase MprF [Bavariicoccus seileri]
MNCSGSVILFFTTAGLSVLSLVTLVLMLFNLQPAIMNHYWVWVIGGSLYFPCLLVITRGKKARIWSSLKQREIFWLLGSSVLEWLGVFSFFAFTGFILGVSYQLSDLFPILITSFILGILSMIPGGIGSFDLFMIIGLQSLGISREVALTWLFLYRLFYFIIPFLIGLLLFGKNLASRINKKWRGIPGIIWKKFTSFFLISALYFSGILLVLTSAIPDAFVAINWLKRLDIFSFHLISSVPSIVIGFLLLVAGRATACRVKKAYWFTLGVIAFSTLFTFLDDFSLFTTLFFIALLIIVFLSKNYYSRARMHYSWEAFTIDGAIYFSLIILYLIIGIQFVPYKHHLHLPKAFVDFYLFPNEKAWLASFMIVLAIGLLNSLIFRYLSKGKSDMLDPTDTKRVRKVLNDFGGNETSHLAFTKDKYTYYYQNSSGEDVAFLQFQNSSNKYIVMGEPSGDSAYFPGLIQAFLDDCDVEGVEPLFYEVKENFVMYLHEFGYDFIKMGEEGWVDLKNFSLKGKKNRGIRSIMNHFNEQSITFEVLMPPFSDDLFRELDAVSNNWLNGRPEKGFSVGFFDKDYLSQAPIAIVKNHEGAIIAFANIMPSYTEENISVDLMRHALDPPNGTMDFLFVSLFSYFQEQGYTSFNLGMAPFSNVGHSEQSFWEERIGCFLYEFGNNFYSFKGLRQYKEKYVSTWIPKYTVYTKKSSFFYNMIHLLRVVGKNKNEKIS